MIRQLYMAGARAFSPDIKYNDETKTLYIGKDVKEEVIVRVRGEKYIWSLFDTENMNLYYLVDEDGNYINNLDVKNIVVEEGNKTMQIVDGCLTKAPNKTLWVPERHDFPKDEKYNLTFLDGEALAQKNYNGLTMKYDDSMLMISGRMRYYSMDSLEEANYIKRIIFPVKLKDEIKTMERIKEYEIKTTMNMPEIFLLVGNINGEGKFIENR